MKFKFPKFGSGKRAEGDTLLLHFVRRNVCNHKAPVGDLILPLTPAFLMVDITQQASFFAIWGFVVIFFLVLWLIVPCNKTLNCNNKKQKDGTKAFLLAFLITYGILIVVAVMARVFMCTDGKALECLLDREGGILDNFGSLFGAKINGNEKKQFPKSVEHALESFRNKGLKKEENIFDKFKQFK